MEGSDAEGVVFLQYLGEKKSHVTTGGSREKIKIVNEKDFINFWN